MASFKEQSFAERRAAAEEARKAKLEAFKARPGKDDPKVQERIRERQATLKAREERAAERERLRLIALAEQEAEDARQAAIREQERIAAEEAKIAEEAARKAEKLKDAARVIADEAERKAARDARYAARKARQR